MIRKCTYLFLLISSVLFFISFYFSNILSYLSDNVSLNMHVESSKIDVSIDNFQVGVEKNGTVTWKSLTGSTFDVSAIQNQIVHIRFTVKNNSPFDVSVQGNLDLSIISPQEKPESNIFFLYPSTIPSESILKELSEHSDASAIAGFDTPDDVLNSTLNKGMHVPVLNDVTLNKASQTGNAQTFSYKLVMSDSVYDVYQVRRFVLNTRFAIGVTVDVNGKDNTANWSAQISRSGSIIASPYLKPNITIEILGDNPAYISQYERYLEYGARVRNEWLEPEEYIVTGRVDTSQVGVYFLSFRPTNPNYPKTYQRVVYVTDGQAPVIHAPPTNVVKFTDENFSLKDLVRVSDNVDSEEWLMQKLAIKKPTGYSPTKPGEYTICYNVRDDSLLHAEEVCVDLTLVGFTDVALMEHTTLALTTQGRVYAWGKNDQGQAGLGANTSDILKPQAIESLQNVNIVDVEAGSNYAMALSDTGQVYMWGSNNYGVLGNGTSTSNSTTPTLLSGLGTVTQIEAGSNTALALNDQGEVYVWGQGASYATGIGNTNNVHTPTKMTFPDNAVIQSINQGWGAGFALSTDNKLYAWGNGTNWKFLSAQSVQYRTPTEITEYLTQEIKEQGILEVKGGGSHVALLTQAGNVFTWGSDEVSQLGNGSGRTDMSTPYMISVSKDPDNKIQGIVVGESTNIALSLDNTAYVFGKSTNYELGFVRNVHFPYAVCIPSQTIVICGENDKRMVAGDTYNNTTAFITTTGTIYMTGSNTNGELGRGTTSPAEMWGEIVKPE